MKKKLSMDKMRLIKKEKLTHDVYELVFDCDKSLIVLPGQFITFVLTSWLRRAYSISNQIWNKFEFIIKRLEDWRWWSKELCDLDIWVSLDFIWPVWHFVLKKNDSSKLFIWTWTGFAPLYFQIINALEKWFLGKVYFIFWIRESRDIFYGKQLNFLKNRYTNFDFRLFLSREDKIWVLSWYVTDFLIKDNIFEFGEFYICWSPAMVESSRQKLEDIWIEKENIYFEKY